MSRVGTLPSPRFPRTRRPKQARAEATVRNLIRVSIELLLRDGVANFSTNHVAARAEVNVATVYRYFQDKDAILAELLRLDVEARIEAFASLLRRLKNQAFADWCERFVEVACEHDGVSCSGQLRRALDGVPTLDDLSTCDRDEETRRLAEALTSRWRFLDEAGSAHVAELFLAGVATTVELSRRHPERADAVRAEGARLLHEFVVAEVRARRPARPGHEGRAART